MPKVTKYQYWFKLTFEDHINRICKKASAQLNALIRTSCYMDPLKWRLLMNAFFTSQFNYYPLTWIFHSIKLNNKLNSLHKWCLRLIYSGRFSSYEKLLDKNNSVPIYQKDLQKLLLPFDLKNSHSLDSFKSRIKDWQLQKCPFRLCNVILTR